jgi:hypothetical protein
MPARARATTFGSSAGLSRCHADRVEAERTGPKGWTLPRILAIAVSLALILFWIWIFSGGPRKTNPDYLKDRGWTDRTEATCARTVKRIDALPPAPDSTTSAARADVVSRANDELDEMLDAIEADEPTGEGDLDVVRPWLADWRTYLGDRRDYAERLRTDPHARLFVDEKFNDSIETVIETFAEVNEMPSCVVPGDVA